MHAVLCAAGGELWAIPTAHVVEVLPIVRVHKHHAGTHRKQTDWINYGGRVVPVWSFPAVLGNRDWRPRMSGRIVLVAPSADRDRTSKLVGLLVASVSAGVRLPVPDPATDPEPATWAPITLTSMGPVRWIEPRRLVDLLESSDLEGRGAT